LCRLKLVPVTAYGCGHQWSIQPVELGRINKQTNRHIIQTPKRIDDRTSIRLPWRKIERMTHKWSCDGAWNSRDIPPCLAERGEQERLPQGGSSFGPLVGALVSRRKKPPPTQTRRLGHMRTKGAKTTRGNAKATRAVMSVFILYHPA
jgi:hypothetical protein